MKWVVKITLLALIIGALAGGVTAHLILENQLQDREAIIKDFYYTETAIHVSPHHIRKAMDKGESDFILVDLRSQEEYEREHIIGAINIPAYSDPEHSAYDQVDRIVSEFAALPKDKDVIVYCYSIPCMTGRKVGKILADSGIYVKHLGVGWNEWRYFWTMWNHEHEWNVTNVEDYVYTGSAPGKPQVNLNSTACPIEGGLGC
ncbi:hypothetical protein CL622_06505 [archaeon]|nr:hypothetical protein [archaeon]|tara:strand:- start:412 stop:1020 length:609 start_codon:yes stop_codon:yes gene_type:complete